MNVRVKCTQAKILKIVDETHDAKTFRLRPDDAMVFKPGQFFMVGIEINKKIVKRAYSASCSPLKDYVEITVKLHSEGIFSNALFKKCVNDEISLEGPYGKFVFEEGSCNKAIFIGAGSGVATLRGIIYYILDKKLDVDSSLFFYYRTEGDIIYRSELERLKEKNLDVNISLTKASNGWEGLRGRINKEHLGPVLDGTRNQLFYICGPSDFVKGAINILENNGVKPESIKHEIYG